MNFLEDIRNVAQIVFQLTASGVAIFGLRSWMIQLKGKTEYEVAKNVIAGAYRIRDEIKRCQEPFIASNEGIEYKPKERETAAQRLAAESWFVHRQRYEKVVAAVNDWYPHTVEAEALFGGEARQIVDKLEDCCKILRSAIEIYYSNLYLGQENSSDKIFKNIVCGISPKRDSYL